MNLFVFFNFEPKRCWGGGSPNGVIHNLLMQLFTLGSSKIELLETYFFDTVIT